MLQLKLFEEKDYPEVCRWWTTQDWPLLPLEALGDIGMIAWNDAVPLAAGWLYMMTKYWCLIEWMVVNPDAPMKDRKLGLELILDRLKSEGQSFGAKAVFSSLRSNGLIRMYKKHGFSVTETGMTNAVFKF